MHCQLQVTSKVLLQKMQNPLFKGALFCMEGYSHLHGLCQTLNLSDDGAMLLLLSTGSLQTWKNHGLLAHLVLYMRGYICLSLLPKDSKTGEFFTMAHKNLFPLNHFA